MRTLARGVIAGLAAAAGIAGTAWAAGEPAFSGCYARAYDQAHMQKHKAQIVSKATLDVKAPPADWPPIDGKPAAAMADLKLWVRGHKQPFETHGVCWSDGDGLRCGGSLSAAEAEPCETKRDGVRNCRVDATDSGAFGIRRKGAGLLVVIVERLELVPAPFDGGPFLSLSPGNAENHAFELAAATCR